MIIPIFANVKICILFYVFYIIINIYPCGG